MVLDAAWQVLLSVVAYALSLRLFRGRETEFAPDRVAMVVHTIIDAKKFILTSGAAQSKHNRTRRAERNFAAHSRRFARLREICRFTLP
jgi:hypothetical protein